MNWPKLPDSDRILSLAAFFISIGTFLVYVYEARLLQKQQYASVLPYLELWNSGGTDDYRLILGNNGTGPAFIKEVKIHYRGKVYPMDHAQFYQRVILPTDTINFAFSNIGAGRVIPAGREAELITVTRSEKDTRKLRRLFGDEKAMFEITYSSVFDETWQLKGMEDPPKKLD